MDADAQSRMHQVRQRAGLQLAVRIEMFLDETHHLASKLVG
ncbi:hypothetical protein [Sinorhizobium medicae]